MSKCPFLFVYGTLMRKKSIFNAKLEQYARFYTEASVKGRLYHLGSYPGLKLDESGNTIPGEVYEVISGKEKELFIWLDVYEGVHPFGGQLPEYERVLAQVMLKDGITCQAWLYEYLPNASNFKEISAWK